MSTLDDLLEGHVDPSYILQCFDAGLVRLVEDSTCRDSTVCRIGDGWFFFDTPEADDMGPDEYLESHDEGYIAEKIADVLEGLFESDRNEYEYYVYYLDENMA